MISPKAFQTNEFCPTCGKNTPADKLKVLLYRHIPTASETNPDWVTVGRFCGSCMPGHEGLERKFLGPEFELKIIAFVSSEIEGKQHHQFRK